MSIGADPAGVGRVAQAFADFADAHAVPAPVRRCMSVALDELLANSVSYGLEGREADGEVSVTVDLDPNRLVLTLRDNGSVFDPFSQSTPDTTLAVEDRPIGGQGIHLVRRLMDEARYERSDGQNIVTLTKRLVAGSAVMHHGENMEITTRTQGDVRIVAIRGKLDSITSPQAQQALEGILTDGARKLAVDFSALDYISSAGLRVLLGAAKQLKSKGGALRMFGLNDTVREVFEISGFSTILAVHGTEAEAVAGF
jgi:anti-anti-sigma factor